MSYDVKIDQLRDDVHFSCDVDFSFTTAGLNKVQSYSFYDIHLYSLEFDKLYNI